MSGPVLVVENLVTEFPTRAGVLRAVDGVSLHVSRGEVLGLVGESGSGKSVTGFSILGLIDPPGRIAAGSVRFEGQELVGMPLSRLRGYRGRRIAMVFQDPMMTLNPLITIFGQMRMALEAHVSVGEAEARARCVAVLGRVGIPDPASRLDAYPHQFSGGMRQRVAIAIALLHDPAVIIADEPTTALDVSIQAQILVEMRALVAKAGMAMIWISHDLATISVIADRIAVMYGGRIVETGRARDVLSRPRHRYTEGLLGSLPSRALPGEDLRQIPGTTPSLVDLPPGCAFAPRCPAATDVCRTVTPEETVVADRRFRCHHPAGLVAEEVA